jgi:preprotein translocase subunit SecF
MNQPKVLLVVLLSSMMLADFQVNGQSPMPDILKKGALNEQFNYLDEHTKIYEDYRAIREDMFQLVKANVSDTLASVYNKMRGINKTTSSLNQTIDTLRTNLVSTQTRLDEMTKTKDSISVIGMEVNKSTYNRIMWTILAGMVAALLIVFFVFKRNLTATENTNKEFQELKTEFETYRKSSREAREKMTMDHFNEIRRLKSGGS